MGVRNDRYSPANLLVRHALDRRRITREASTIGKQARVVKATVKLMTVGLRGCLGGLFTATFSLRSIRSNHPRRPRDVRSVFPLFADGASA